MSKSKKLLGVLMAIALVFNTLAIGASAVLGDGNELSANIALQVGWYNTTTKVFTPLAAGETLKTNDVITVRICPQTDFLVGSSEYVAMFDKAAYSIVGINKAAFTANTANTFYDQTASGYSGVTQNIVGGTTYSGLPTAAWPATFGSTENYSVYTAIKVGNLADTNSNNGGYPNLLPGDWLFQFSLKVLKDLPAGSNARIWMDSRWFRTVNNKTVDGYFAKCLEGSTSSSGLSTIYNFEYDMSAADFKLPLPAPVTGTITFDSAGGSAVAPITGNVGDAIIPPANPSKTNYTFTGWSPALPATFPVGGFATTATWSLNQTTITFDSAGGTAVSPVTGGVGTAVPAITAPTKANYTFAGWSPAIPATFPASGFTAVAQWTINKTTITFDSNGGTSVLPVTGDIGSAVPAVTPPTKANYTFAGWSPALPATFPAGGFATTATWTLNQTTISFDSNGGTSVSPVTGDIGSAVPAVTAPTRENYTFAGWSPAIPATFPASGFTAIAQWTINQTTITFDSNGGTAVSPVTGDIGSTVPAITAPVKTGFTFIGWSPALPATMPSENTTYTAQWAVNSYTITFDANGGTGGTSIKLEYGAALTPPTVSRTGYTFIGWSPDIPATVGSGDATYTAQWNPNSYVITFDANGGTGDTSGLFEYGSPLTAPVVTKTGYTLTGWSPSLPGTVPATDTTYVAQWSANSYTITFDANSGTGGTSGIMVYGTTLIAPTVTKTGYTFTGWSPEVPTTVPAGNTTYTAQWTINSYTVSFDANGGTGSALNVTQDYGTEVTLPTMGFVKTGYTFIGWNTAPNATTVLSSYYVPAADMTLYAVYEIGFFWICFDANGGTGFEECVQVRQGDAIPLPTKGFTKTGSTFIGWNTDPKATTTVVGPLAISDMTFYAIYEINQYTVSFNANGGTGSATDVTQDYGTEVTLPTTGFAKTGYTFIGWNTTPGAVTALAYYKVPAGDSTLYAIYEINQYTVSFDANGGTGSAPNITQDYGTEVTLPAIGFAKTGYTFQGWNTTANATTALSNYYMPAGDVTLYAVYGINTYNAIFMVDGNIYQTVPTVYDIQIIAPANPAKAGCTFIGWSPSVGTMGAGDMNFNALFTISGYTVHYVVDGNFYRDVTVPAGSTVPADPSVVMPEMARPTKPGYTLIGWSVTPMMIMPEHDIIVSALWSMSKVTISINWGGTIEFLTGSPGDYVLYDQRTITGYTFTGFSPAIPTTFPSTDLAVTALWMVNTYNVFFMSDGDLYATVPTLYGTQIVAPANPTKEGYTFAGWDSIPATMPATNIILNALWHRIPVTLTVKAGSTAIINESNGFISGLEEGMTVETFLSSFMTVNGDGRIAYQYYTDSFGTGTRIDLIDNVTGLVVKTYYIVIYGDVDGDGYITAADENILGMVASYQMSFDEGSAFECAGDLTQDEQVDTFDLNLVSAAANYSGTISQTTPWILV